jgi:deoxyribodipyrimidine photo-lyase
MMHDINEKRIRLLQNGDYIKGPVVYWMSRDQRMHDNWALLYAQNLALEIKEPLIVIFCLLPGFLNAAFRQFGFMLKGLEILEKEFSRYNIPLFLLKGEPETEIPKFIDETKAGKLVADFDPLKIKRIWKRNVAEKINIPFYEVDAHNIVPTLYASGKEEYGAYTIRPKIYKALPEFLFDYPEVIKMKKYESVSNGKINWQQVEESLKIDLKIKEVDWIKPGFKKANEELNYFLKNKLDNYAEFKNDPVKEGQSNLSPYLHFGQISAQRIALEVKRINGNMESEKSFLEELIVRRELSDNFCYFNKNYDSFNGFKDWAKESLIKHKKDKREYVYTLEQFERAETHEDLWNAAQIEMIKTGKMHGYMRMYWAKKILEWSDLPEKAMKIAVYLNDKYELDGRDPNGYTGCAWSIGGIHDRAWQEREIFGKIRYMNKNGAKRKFNISEYIRKFSKS